MVAKLVTSGLVLTWNSLTNKFWTSQERIFQVPGGEKYEYDVSVIIPSFNEERRIEKTLNAINDYFSAGQLTRQIIIVDDGSTDNTVRIVEGLRKKIKNLSIIAYRFNRGKGHAIKKGIESCRGRYILFTDADNSTPIEEFDKFCPFLKDNELVIGSRYLAGSKIVVKQPLYRVFIGRLANMVIQFSILDGIRDTQCGFKAFQHEAAKEIFSRMKVERFGFDIEILSIAQLLNFHVKEVPVSWYNSPESRLRPIKDTFRTLSELIYIKLNLWGGRYS
ncbi:MAG: dolichyl-phosphate beta-glucosyltransferase [Dissulfurispiraceae bacterium]